MGIEMVAKTGTQEPFTRGLLKVGGLSFIVWALLHIMLVALGALLPSVASGISVADVLQSLPKLSIVYGSFVGTIVTINILSVFSFSILYLVLRRTNQFAALAGLILIVVAIGINLAVGATFRYAQLNLAVYYASTTSDPQRLALMSTYQFASDIVNIATLIGGSVWGLSYLFTGYAILKDRSSFGRLAPYLVSLSGILLMIAPLAADTTANTALTVITVIVEAAFGILAGIRLRKLA